jgi:hypothetical protein
MAVWMIVDYSFKAATSCRLDFLLPLMMMPVLPFAIPPITDLVEPAWAHSSHSSRFADRGRAITKGFRQD